MFSLTLLVLSVGAACGADQVEPSQPPASGPDSLSDALTVDDACLADDCPSSLALMQLRGLPVHDAGEVQVKANVQRRPARVAPQANDPLQIFLQESVPGPWGDVIDAGTGPSSLLWLASCPLNTITAVTANESSVKSSLAESGEFLDLKLDKVIAGDWKDPEFLKGQKYNVVVADWLLGSVEGFEPHFQVGLVRRLKGLVAPGGWLLLTGREPDHLKANSTAGARLLHDVDALRDAATTLGLNHPYRELPQWWVEDELGASGFHVHKQMAVPLTTDPVYIFDQLEWAGDEIKKVRDERLRAALEERKEALHQFAKQTQSEWEDQSSGKEYAIVARLK